MKYTQLTGVIITGVRDSTETEQKGLHKIHNGIVRDTRREQWINKTALDNR